MKYYIGLDIGGTKCAASFGEEKDGTVRILAREEIPTHGRPQELLPLFDGFFEKHIKSYPIEGVGISCGGPLCSKTGVILTPPNLPFWHGFPIVEFVKKRYNLPAKLENDANACALAEWRLGAGRGATNVIFLTFGTGLGAGVILDGKLYSGTNGNAGEAGHIRLSDRGPIGFKKRGSFEGFCSGGGIAQLAEQMAKKERETPFCMRDFPITTKKLARAAKDGDPFAKKVFEKSGKMLGKGLSILVDLFNPEKIVIGGVFMRSGELLRPAMERQLKKEALPEALAVCEIVPAQLSENIGDYAAIAVAMR